jgi:hypothetical protein
MRRSSSLLPGAAALALLLAACTAADRPAETPPTAAATPTEAPASPAPAAATLPPPEAAAPAIPVAKDEHLLLKPGYVGPLRLNMKEADLLTLLPPGALRRVTRRFEGIAYPALEYRSPDAPASTPPTLLELVGSEEEGNRLWRVQLRDARFRTAEGLGVGSTYGEVRRAYGVQTIEAAEGEVGAVSERVGMTWLLDRRALPVGRQLRKEEVPPGTRITGIILYQ